MPEARVNPPQNCGHCPRLVALRRELQTANPEWFNAPVPSFGSKSAQLLIVGLAPGLNGANRTGRPFTGDYAGDLLYQTLDKLGLTTGKYNARPDDGLELQGCMITNAVRCLPPQNKPVGAEIGNCRQFLMAQIGALSQLTAILALGRVAHESVLRAHGLRLAAHPFGHGAKYILGDGLTLVDSYHCSRYNTNTRRLTTQMFEDVVKLAKQTAQL